MRSRPEPQNSHIHNTSSLAGLAQNRTCDVTGSRSQLIHSLYSHTLSLVSFSHFHVLPSDSSPRYFPAKICTHHTSPPPCRMSSRMKALCCCSPNKTSDFYTSQRSLLQLSPRAQVFCLRFYSLGGDCGAFKYNSR